MVINGPANQIFRAPRRELYIPEGFLFSSVEAAIKGPGKRDLALIYSVVESSIWGMFTTNRVKAAPVRLCMRMIKTGRGQAIVVNSGNANACTGEQGMRDAAEMAELAAGLLKLRNNRVFVCSTGVIGRPMPMEKIRPKISELVGNIGTASIMDVAAAIMTTDTFQKIISRQIEIGGRRVTILGICKGAGMISPNMATMLCFIMTDADIERVAAKTALEIAVKKSFNRITVDGDMSTNDTTLLMANGMAGNDLIQLNSREFKEFSSMLSDITYELSRMIVRDGEGATKLIEVKIKNSKSGHDAEKGAFAVANSLLVKTAIYGNDANWGRIMSALGYSGIAIKEEKIDISFNGLKVVERGIGTGRDREADERLKAREISIVIDLHLGKETAKVLTCDLTEEYVRINAEYRT
ncbi:bifunctional glutamate N-acetyltransferase/amino-acid acetyltransferase ArgJ [Thermodesulfovibrionales bacterium]|nr:bifunctional glutamate N-acetyltransferase/amino-acid acetyltransferase ArgJ [Thermodesulfovibrionales bacterium]MCL0040739.1 bifunctional glutamate N-acetyltransferase/amino-acid acetyltransferase ArgJ [Thermodesulfovibrionales bacterium]MCL0046713.1 bifunctional glutamate N-acetyltransferase/amino-acid acetyltransferase ArgJ [Thermodesulfovibrionales bacterium]MCL0074907.1 bifunctional glutamate N-acetyltransferase/amino-acid acetyltransferase ArgJ [Thermodesulfovibrionales bacterium]MCL00